MQDTTKFNAAFNSQCLIQRIHEWLEENKEFRVVYLAPQDKDIEQYLKLKRELSNHMLRNKTLAGELTRSLDETDYIITQLNLLVNKTYD